MIELLTKSAHEKVDPLLKNQLCTATADYLGKAYVRSYEELVEKPAGMGNARPDVGDCSFRNNGSR